MMNSLSRRSQECPLPLQRGWQGGERELVSKTLWWGLLKQTYFILFDIVRHCWHLPRSQECHLHLEDRTYWRMLFLYLDALTFPRAISSSLWTSFSTTCQSAAVGSGGERGGTCDTCGGIKSISNSVVNLSRSLHFLDHTPPVIFQEERPDVLHLLLLLLKHHPPCCNCNLLKRSWITFTFSEKMACIIFWTPAVECVVEGWHSCKAILLQLPPSSSTLLPPFLTSYLVSRSYFYFTSNAVIPAATDLLSFKDLIISSIPVTSCSSSNSKNFSGIGPLTLFVPTAAFSSSESSYPGPGTFSVSQSPSQCQAAATAGEPLE